MKIQRPQLGKMKTPRVEQKSEHDQKITAVAQGMERIFLKHLIEKMRDTVPKGGMDQSQAQKVYANMLDDEYAKMWAEGGGIGLSKMIEKQLRQPGVPPSPRPLPQPSLPGKKVGSENP